MATVPARGGAPRARHRGRLYSAISYHTVPYFGSMSKPD
jgi:hypothetical protein